MKPRTCAAMSPARSEHERRGAWAALLCLLALLPYLQTLDFGFVADDHVYLGLSNSRLLDLELTDLWRLAVAPANPWEYLPLRDLSYWFDLALHDDPQFGLHLGNFLWYAAACAAVAFAVGETLRLTKPEWAHRHRELALLAAALFAAHPSHAEVVAWVAARKDLMAGTLVFLAWGISVRAVSAGAPARVVALALMFWLAAGLSKSTAVVPMMLSAMLFFLQPASASRYFRFGLPLLFLACAVGLAILHAEVARSTGIRIENTPGLPEVIGRASRILAALLEILFLPLDAAAIRDVYSLGSWHVVVSGVALASCIAAAGWLVLRQKNALIAWALLWLVVPLLPYLQILPFSTWSMASDRFVFQAGFGAALLLVAVLGHVGVRRGGVLALSLTLGGIWLTLDRLPAWQSEQLLWEREARRDPQYFNSVRAHAMQLAGRGEFATAAERAQGVLRQDARTLLLDYLAWRREERDQPSGWMADPERRKRFCAEGLLLLERIEAGFSGMRMERDIPFNNFLRNMEKAVNPSGGLVRICGKAI